MKKLILASIFSATTLISVAQNAFNFTANDCASTSHDLFTELDNGKTIIMVFVMPCSACVGSSVNAANTVTQMANPDVLFYLFDDAGNNNCSSLSSWESTNSVVPTATFDNSGNTNPQSNYGSGGMPKVVIVGGGTAHKVYLAQNGSVGTAAMQNAINNSVWEITGVSDIKNLSQTINVFLNSSASSAEINYSLTKKADVSVEVFSTLGQKVFSTSILNQASGKQKVEFSTENFNDGIYFATVTADGETATLKFSVVK